MKAKFAELILQEPISMNSPWAIEWWRDPVFREMIAKINGQDVHIQDEMTKMGTLDYARKEWRAIWELDQQQRKDCGCPDCMKGVRGIGKSSTVEVYR